MPSEAIAFHFPRQRPASATFDAWAERVGDQLTRELLEEGLAELGAAERTRIPAEFDAANPQVWEKILDDVGGHDDAHQILLIGAVVAGLEERHRQVDPDALELLEMDEEAREDPVESLALTLAATDLWSAFEIIDATESFDKGATTAAIAEQLWSEWHEQRLEDLVHRLRDGLPVAGFAAASSAIESGCRAFTRDLWVRTRLRSELLLDALPTAAHVVGSRRVNRRPLWPLGTRVIRSDICSPEWPVPARLDCGLRSVSYGPNRVLREPRGPRWVPTRARLTLRDMA